MKYQVTVSSLAMVTVFVEAENKTEAIEKAVARVRTDHPIPSWQWTHDTDNLSVDEFRDVEEVATPHTSPEGAGV